MEDRTEYWLERVNQNNGLNCFGKIESKGKLGGIYMMRELEALSKEFIWAICGTLEIKKRTSYEAIF